MTAEPMTVQELFDAWWKARQSVIWEYSGTIAEDIDAAYGQALATAESLGLTPPEKPDLGF